MLDADGRAGLACVQSLGRAGYEIHAGMRAAKGATRRSRWCGHVHLQPPAEPLDAAVEWLLELDRQCAFVAVLPTTEASLRWLRQLPEAHPLRIKAVLASNESLDSALDKEQTRDIARSLGLPVPESRLIPRAAAPPAVQGDFPKVLKPIHSKVVIGSRLTTLAVAIARNADERDATLAAWLPFVAVQEQNWVPGRGVGVEMLYDRGRMIWHFAHERLHEWPLTGGASTWRRACGAEQDLVRKSQALLDRLQWHGVAMVEWRRDSNGALHLMEINPRLWGSLPLTIAAGVDIPLGVVALARNQLPAPAPKWREGVTARNLTDDFQWFIENIKADRTDPSLLTEPVWRAALGWLRALTGRESWDGWSVVDPGVAFGEVIDNVKTRASAAARRAREHFDLKRLKQRHAKNFGPDRAASKRISRVLFLCFGNICRSPFASAAALDRLRGVTIDSAGFHTTVGRYSPQHVVEAARTLGVDLTTCTSNRVSQEQVDAADLILCMDLANLHRLAAEFPQALPNSTLLGLFRPEGPEEIRDPYDLAPAATRVVLLDILLALDAFAAWLLKVRDVA